MDTTPPHDGAPASGGAQGFPPVPADTKDWTWVLARACPECGFDATTVDRTAVARLIRENATRWQELLRRPVDLAARPSDDRWSPLEYACHVRDVYVLYDERLHLMLDEDDPTFRNWDHPQRRQIFAGLRIAKDA